MPEKSKTLVVHGLKLETATDLLNKAVSSSYDISGAIFLPTEPECSGCVMNVETTFKLNDLKYGGSLTAFRIEGSKNSVDERIQNLKKELKIVNFKISTLESYQSEIFWNKIKNLEFFSSTGNNILRVVVPPSQSVQLVFQLSNKFLAYSKDSLLLLPIIILGNATFSKIVNSGIR